jgi:hypothetical protein
MRLILSLCAVLLLPSQAWALCRCACVRGVMRPICQETDLVQPICQGLCEDEIRASPVLKPLFGGRQVANPVESFDPAPRDLTQRDPNFNFDTRGNPLGTAGVDTGNDAFTRSTGPAAAGGASR